MKKLSNNFSLNKYGLNVRLINKNDADFILSLRANPEKTRHMVTLDYDIKSQEEWIEKYKKREDQGLDYYFIYSKNKSKPIGVNRISHIDPKTKTAKLSSWIAIKGLKYEAIKMHVIKNEIAFNILGLSSSYGEVHKKNIRAIRIFNLFGYEFTDIDCDFYKICIEKNDFIKACKKNKVIHFLQT